MKVRLFVMAVAFLCISILAQAQEREGASMRLTCPDFVNNSYMPDKFTCEGNEVSPELIVEGLPAQAKSLALIVDDPDAPNGIWVHWVVFDIPVTAKITEGSIPGKQGINNAGGLDYHGPCPPSGTHRYYFKIYALDAMLNLNEGISKAALEKAMQGHILAKAELIGLYQRKGH